MDKLLPVYNQRAFNEISRYGKIALEVIQQQIAQMGFRAHVHFELEGGFLPNNPVTENAHSILEYDAINRVLAENSIQGHLKPEYWSFQWEYVSNFEGQSPMKVATDLHWVIANLPDLLKQHGANDVFIKPVVWGGDKGRLAPDCDNIFSTTTQSVHVPNAIQINISATDSNRDNVIAKRGVGERVQHCLLQTSRECCLLYLPELEAFERLRLKDQFGLSRELSSPNDLSGGHQGSIALYRKKGKHNQLIGEIPLLLDAQHSVMISRQDWRPLSRVEHRLGAASVLFNPYAATVFALANLSDALATDASAAGSKSEERTQASGDGHKIETPTYGQLPDSLYEWNDRPGAVELFEQSCWLENKIDRCAIDTQRYSDRPPPPDLGSLFKHAVLRLYQKSIAQPSIYGVFA